MLEAALVGTNVLTGERWEVTLDGRIGFPTGRLRVMDRPTPGTPLRLRDLGIDVSKALEGSGTRTRTSIGSVSTTSVRC
jgi:hypothetical protein